MPNTVQLTKNGQPVYPVTDVSLITGLEERSGMRVIPYSTQPTASADTVGFIYMDEDTQDLYITKATSGSYTWVSAGNLSDIDLDDYATKNELNQLGQKVDKLGCGLALMTRTASPAGSMAIPILELNKQYYVKFNLSATKTFAVTLRKQDGSSGVISQTIAASKEYAPGEYYLPFVFTDSDGVYLRIGEAGVWSSVSNVVLYQSSGDSIQRINREIAPINDELEELTARVGGTTKSDTITEVNDVIWDGTKFIAPTAALKGYYFPIYKGTRYTWVVNSGTALSIGLFGVKPEDGAIAPRLQNLTSLSSYDCEQDGLYIAFAFQFPTSTYGSPSLTITKNYSGVADKVGAIEQEVSEVSEWLAELNSEYIETKTDVSGIDSIRSYTETDYNGIYWDGEKFVAGDANYNSFVIRLYRSGHYEWKVPTGTPISIGIFGKKPVIGEYASRLQNLTSLSSYDCENDGYYLVATFSVSPSPEFELTSVMLGVFNALYGYKKDSVLNNSMLANIMNDGSKFISVAPNYAYNSIVIPLIKGRTYSWITTKTNIANVKVYDAKPEAGLVITPVRDITSRSPFTCKNDGYYMVFLFNLTQDNVIDVRFNIAESGYIQKIDRTLSFKGKTIVCIGDSTTEGINDTDEFGGYRRGLGSGYPSYLQEYYGGTFINGGIGGTNLVPRARGGADAPYEYLDGVNLVNAIVTGTWEDQIQAATNLSAQDDKLLPAVTALSELNWSKVDAIVLKYGINDWGTNMPLGTIDSTNPSDYYGAINIIVQKLCTAFPGKQILFITHEAGYHGAKADEYWSSTWKNSQNLTMEDYVAATIAGCAKWCLPCFDLYHCFGVNKYNWATFYGTDYIHPIRAGYQKMADVLSKYLLEKICPR